MRPASPSCAFPLIAAELLLNVIDVIPKGVPGVLMAYIPSTLPDNVNVYVYPPCTVVKVFDS